MIINLGDISTPKLRAIRQILDVGVTAHAENAQVGQLCHKSPPKGYPKEKSEYGDPECYRYPLNTKARCLAAWRYVHHADNKSILGKKFGSIESKIKSYAKEHYKLDLQTSESDSLDWGQAFVEYYDSETMGERCECIVLEEEKENMDETKEVETLKSENTTLKSEKEAWLLEKSTLASQVESFTKELNDQKKELERLTKFENDTNKAAEKAERIKTIKSKLEEAGLTVNLDDETEAKYWLDMSEDVLKLTISKMGELKKGAKASASINIPNISSEDKLSAVDVVRRGLQEKRGKK